MSERDTLREAARAYLDAEAEPAYSWVLESQAARDEGRPNREVERMDRIARARVALEEALAATPTAALDVEPLARALTRTYPGLFGDPEEAALNAEAILANVKDEP